TRAGPNTARHSATAPFAALAASSVCAARIESEGQGPPERGEYACGVRGRLGSRCFVVPVWKEFACQL
uniref:hypothetical protein n=1 Tax=Nocardia abscessus TaxID=120957 RepID=UPI002454D444